MKRRTCLHFRRICLHLIKENFIYHFVQWLVVFSVHNQTVNMLNVFIDVFMNLRASFKGPRSVTGRKKETTFLFSLAFSHSSLNANESYLTEHYFAVLCQIRFVLWFYRVKSFENLYDWLIYYCRLFVERFTLIIARKPIRRNVKYYCLPRNISNVCVNNRQLSEPCKAFRQRY